MRQKKTAILLLSIVYTILVTSSVCGQQPDRPIPSADVRVMTIPISIFTETELKKNRLEEIVQAGRLSVTESKDEQEILSLRSVSNQPLAIAILIQEDLTTEVNLQLPDIREFIRELPADSKVMVAYMRGGALQVRQGFTRDLEKAAKSIRIVTSSPASAPRSPYDSLRDALKRFDGLPNGRRAVFMVSDGLDISGGFANSSPGINSELDRAIRESQKRGVAVYSIYATGSITRSGNARLILNGQGSLNRLAEQTGGRAFFQGSSTPVSFRPFFATLERTLSRQFALTYLSTHMDSGYYRVEVESTNPEVKIDHPRGYYYRKVRNK